SPAAALARLARSRPLGPVEERAFRAAAENPDGSLLQLSRFQVEAAVRLLNPPSNGTNGMIVSAGTGTGKTLAFYLPCLMTVAHLMERDRFWTQALALYPRTELLKDQFTEAY